MKARSLILLALAFSLSAEAKDICVVGPLETYLSYKVLHDEAGEMYEGYSCRENEKDCDRAKRPVMKWQFALRLAGDLSHAKIEMKPVVSGQDIWVVRLKDRALVKLPLAKFFFEEGSYSSEKLVTAKPGDLLYWGAGQYTSWDLRKKGSISLVALSNLDSQNWVPPEPTEIKVEVSDFSIPTKNAVWNSYDNSPRQRTFADNAYGEELKSQQKIVDCD